MDILYVIFILMKPKITKLPQLDVKAAFRLSHLATMMLFFPREIEFL